MKNKDRRMLASGRLDSAKGNPFFDGLDATERQILGRTVCGFQTDQIARAMGLPCDQVKTSLARIFQEKGVDGVAQLNARHYGPPNLFQAWCKTFGLTAPLTDIALGLLEGKETRQIASELRVSVDIFMKNQEELFRRLGIRCQTQIFVTFHSHRTQTSVCPVVR